MAKKQEEVVIEETNAEEVELYNNALAVDAQEAIESDDLYGAPDTEDYIDAAELLEEINPNGVKLTMPDVVLKPFWLLSAKRFSSDMGKLGYALFVRGQMIADGELFHCVIGGEVLMSELLTLFTNRPDRRLLLTIEYVERGEHNSYYKLTSSTPYLGEGS